jgi:hypothetical protein
VLVIRKELEKEKEKKCVCGVIVHHATADDQSDKDDMWPNKKRVANMVLKATTLSPPRKPCNI